MNQIQIKVRTLLKERLVRLVDCRISSAAGRRNRKISRFAFGWDKSPLVNTLTKTSSSFRARFVSLASCNNRADAGVCLAMVGRGGS